MSSSPTFASDQNKVLTAIKIGLAGPEEIRNWSAGEVENAGMLDNIHLPINKGLFCQTIFGPLVDWQCICGKLSGVKKKEYKCRQCGIRVESRNVRRHRMGHIELAAPVVHPLFFKGKSSKLAILLGLKASDLKQIIYYEKFIITETGNDCSYKIGETLSEEEYYQAFNESTPGTFRAERGVEAVRSLLRILDLKSIADELRQKLSRTKSKISKLRHGKRLELIETFLQNRSKLEWIILDVIPVIPPDLRPIVDLENNKTDGRVDRKNDRPYIKEDRADSEKNKDSKENEIDTTAPDDLNPLYQSIIRRNNKIRAFIDLEAPEAVLNARKKMLQQAVDALFNNDQCKPPARSPVNNQKLKSLVDRLKGKEGRFRESLLGKRVNFSGRSVIVSGSNLYLHQCGLPKEIALELYKPFLVRRLKESGIAPTDRVAGKMIRMREPAIWEYLEEIVKMHPVILNRAPTLHRMNVQAFEPVLTDEKAIRLHPLVCRGFNADFDGDQMAVHLPLSTEAKSEVYELLLSTNNLFSPANGAPIVTPSQDIVMGCYYATLEIPGSVGEGKVLSGRDELYRALDHHAVSRHTKIRIRMPEDRWLKDDPNTEGGKLFETTVGRFLFNDLLPGKMPYYNEPLKSGGLASIIQECCFRLGRRKTIDFLDRLMRFGFEECTRSGLSFTLDDLVKPTSKTELIEKAETDVAQVRRRVADEKLSEAQRHTEVTGIWRQVQQEITQQIREQFEQSGCSGDYINPVQVMIASGARGNIEQISQLAGMRGLMAKPDGGTIETPIKSSFREGLSLREYFLSTHGGRKGLIDSAVKTAKAGYLTRRLVFAAQSVVVTCHDCGTTDGIPKKPLCKDNGDVLTKLSERVCGRISCMDIDNPNMEKSIVRQGDLISLSVAQKLDKHNIKNIRIRSPLTCKAKDGICATCYGLDLSTDNLVEEGTAVGIIAAQSIGEPGTQLTLRTFHTGGTANDEKDITSGLPRLDELFEARKPKKAAIMSKREGTVSFEVRLWRDKLTRFIVVSNDKQKDEYRIKSEEPIVAEGDVVQAGQLLTKGEPVLDDILEIRGRDTLIEYLIDELQKVYRGQKVRVDDKHFEIILSQMLHRVRDSVSGNEDEILYGIRKTASRNQSFLARAAFQETADVLAEAAILEKTDPLIALKEAAMAGCLVPVGTGFKKLNASHDKEQVSSSPVQQENLKLQDFNRSLDPIDPETAFHNEQETGFPEYEHD